ncbi:DMT family transporter [Mariprofundus sp. EBB-1]|uniref:DMT family transporter n=1 Tax=Mariprofundus sp. EBB-1 TaxID=2650971 RepID=UPI00191419EE|nr:DMT family transporter [Mariprofundus sp. EBB-1]
MKKSIHSIVDSIGHARFSSSTQMFGLLLAIGAALGFSIKAIFVKLAYQHGVDAITLLMVRMSFALPFFIAFAIIEERKAAAPIAIKDMMLIFLLGLIGYYLSSLLDFIGLQYITAGLERLILFVYPTIVVMISALFFGKRFAKETVIALLLSYFGIALAMYHDLQISGEFTFYGSLLVFGATLSYSMFLVGSGEVIPKVGAKRFTAYAMIISCLAVMIQFGLLREVSDLRQPVEVYLYGFAMAVFSTVIPAFLLASAIHRIGASHTAIVGALGPVVTIVIAAMVLNEAVSLMQMLGALCVIAGVFTLGLKKRA